MAKSKGRRLSVIPKPKNKIDGKKIGDALNDIIQYVSKNFLNINDFSRHRNEQTQNLFRLERLSSDTASATYKNIDCIFALLKVIAQITNRPEEEIESMFQMAYDSIVVISEDGKINGEVVLTKYNFTEV